MRICLLSREYPPDTGWGGIGAYTFQHASALKKLGHDVEVVALAKQDALKEELGPVFDENGIRVHRAIWGNVLDELSTLWISLPYSNFLIKSALALWRKFSEVHGRQPFDVLEAPEHLAEALFPSITKACPLVLRLHTPHSKLVVEGFHNLKPSAFDLQLVAILERIAMLHADLLSSPSDDLAAYVAQDLGYNGKEIAILHNPVDAEKFSPLSDPGKKNDQLNVFFAGRLEERKGISYLIDAVPVVIDKIKNTRFKNVRFTIVGADTRTGPGKASVLNSLKAKLEKSGCAAYVQFVDHVPHSQMPDYYRSADICVVPSLYDNAAYTILEAMACGKPVIGTTAGGTPEYVLHDSTGLMVPPKDSQALASALLVLLQDEQRRLQFGLAGRQRVLDHFERRVIASKSVQTYATAQERYLKNKEHALYLRPKEQLVDDFKQLLYAYHLNLCDLISRHSLVFRVKHWLRLAIHRPKLCLAKTAVGALQPILNLTNGRAGAVHDLVARLEQEVSLKETEREALVLKYLSMPPQAPSKPCSPI